MTKIDEIEARHYRDQVNPVAFSLPQAGRAAHDDRAFLLAEVKRLSAPVTEEKLVEWLDDFVTDQLMEGNSVPDFWDECDTSSRLAAFLKGRMS